MDAKQNPATKFIAITPSNTPLSDTNGSVITRGIIVTSAGTVRCVNHLGADVDIPCAAGVVIPVQTSVIKAGGTATGIVALY